jgi:hypothetical protein
MSKNQTALVNVDAVQEILVRIIALTAIGVVTSSAEQIVGIGRSALFLWQITIKKIITL